MDRSSLASKKSVHCVAGVIDNGYRGEILVAIYNLSRVNVKIKKGDKIAQLILIPLTHTEVLEVTELADSPRGTGGFGSTN